MRLRSLPCLLVIVGCGGGDVDTTITIETITPSFAPLSGGTKVVFEGQGYLNGGAPPNRVVIGNTEAPLAAAADDGTLEVIVPPGEDPGDVEVRVFNEHGSATATGLFHYSTQPSIDNVSPAEVVFNKESTVTITGSGFLDEEAGVASVLVDGVPAVDVEVVSDTMLTFTPRLTGVPFSAANLELTNARGTALKEGGLRFAPIADPALVLLTKNNGTIFTIVYDPVHDVRINIPAITNTGAFKAMIRADNGEFLAVNRFANQFGRLDFASQTVKDSVQLAFFPASMVKLNGQVFAFEKQNGVRIGTFDPTSGSFTPLSTGVLALGPCCGNQQAGGGTAIGANGNNLVYSNGVSLFNVDVTNGQPTSTLALNPGRHIRGLRQIGTTLFGVDALGQVFSINTANGVTTNVKALGAQVLAVELFVPAN